MALSATPRASMATRRRSGERAQRCARRSDVVAGKARARRRIGKELRDRARVCLGYFVVASRAVRTILPVACEIIMRSARETFS
jgi:hypothetical protein